MTTPREPRFIELVRCHPTGEVRHHAGDKVTMHGTDAPSFLAEFDRYVAEMVAAQRERAAATCDAEMQRWLSRIQNLRDQFSQAPSTRIRNAIWEMQTLADVAIACAAAIRADGEGKR